MQIVCEQFPHHTQRSMRATTYLYNRTWQCDTVVKVVVTGMGMSVVVVTVTRR